MIENKLLDLDFRPGIHDEDINFNFRLILAPLEVLDYVVVHELCHRRQMNHSAQFWQEVAQVLPDYRKRKAWLTENGWRLMG